MNSNLFKQDIDEKRSFLKSLYDDFINKLNSLRKQQVVIIQQHRKIKEGERIQEILNDLKNKA